MIELFFLLYKNPIYISSFVFRWMLNSSPPEDDVIVISTPPNSKYHSGSRLGRSSHTFIIADAIRQSVLLSHLRRAMLPLRKYWTRYYIETTKRPIPKVDLEDEANKGFTEPNLWFEVEKIRAHNSPYFTPSQVPLSFGPSKSSS